MEKKTIGKFISALRRASGMTQKELGERLYVSDKTVSRWERDECTPELSLLPALAEIFGITTDELLRGERNSPAAEPTQSQRSRSDKQFRVMLRGTMVRFRNRSMISVGVALAAVILAVVINISFWKGVLAFGIGAVVMLGAVICQLCFTSSALLRPDEEGDPHEAEIRQANSDIITATARVLIAIVTMFAFILPMGVLGSSYYALNLESLMLQGCGYGAIALMAAYVLYVLGIRRILERRGLICPTQGDTQRNKLLKRTLVRCGAVLALLAVILALVSLWGPEIVSREVNSFTDIEEFQDYMQRGAETVWIEETARERGSEAIATPTAVFIDVGNDGLYEDVLFPPEFDQAQILGDDGQVLCSYASYGPFVRDVRWKLDDETGALTITAYTRQGMAEAEELCGDISAVILGLMIVNVAVWSVAYIVKACRIRKE